MTIRTMEDLNQKIRETLDHYYQYRDADSFFTIDALLNLCKENEFSRDEVPALIEMQNVIVMG